MSSEVPAVRPRMIVGDIRQVIPRLPKAAFDLVVTSPPFLGLASYLPAHHPERPLEVGSVESSPGEYLDTLLELTGQWSGLLAPHGSLVVELGDTYASRERSGQGWPLDKSLCGVPTLYAWSLAYGRNLLTGQASPAGKWRIRTLKPWIRTNPPVGALADKERPATSYVVVACRSRDRYFDIDAVRHRPNLQAAETGPAQQDPSGTPPLDWWHQVDGVLDAALRQHAGGNSHARTAEGVDRRLNSGKAASPRRRGNWASLDIEHRGTTGGIRGWHLRRALEEAGVLATAEALAVNARGYSGSHYSTWPEELVRLLIEEMCPRRVCRTCGAPSRRVSGTTQYPPRSTNGAKNVGRKDEVATSYPARTHVERTTLHWTSCGCPGTEADCEQGWHADEGWRAGRILDPFVGSGTTMQVASMLGRAAVGVDLDERNVALALERCGPTLTVEHAGQDSEADGR